MIRKIMPLVTLSLVAVSINTACKKKETANSSLAATSTITIFRSPLFAPPGALDVANDRIDSIQKYLDFWDEFDSRQFKLPGSMIKPTLEQQAKHRDRNKNLKAELVLLESQRPTTKYASQCSTVRTTSFSFPSRPDSEPTTDVGFKATCEVAEKPLFKFPGFNFDGKELPYNVHFRLGIDDNEDCRHQLALYIEEQKSNAKLTRDGTYDNVLTMTDVKGPLTLKIVKVLGSFPHYLDSTPKMELSFLCRATVVASYVTPPPEMIGVWKLEAKNHTAFLEDEFKDYLSMREMTDIIGKSFLDILSKQDVLAQQVSREVFDSYEIYRDYITKNPATGSSDVVLIPPGLDIEPPPVLNTTIANIDRPSLTAAEILKILTQEMKLKIVNKATGKTEEHAYLKFKPEAEYPAWFKEMINVQDSNMAAKTLVAINSLSRHDMLAFTLESYARRLESDPGLSFESFTNSQTNGSRDPSALANALEQLKTKISEVRLFLTSSEYYKKSIIIEYDALMTKIRKMELSSGQ